MFSSESMTRFFERDSLLLLMKFVMLNSAVKHQKQNLKRTSTTFVFPVYNNTIGWLIIIVRFWKDRLQRPERHFQIAPFAIILWGFIHIRHFQYSSWYYQLEFYNFFSCNSWFRFASFSVLLGGRYCTHSYNAQVLALLIDVLQISRSESSVYVLF